MRRFVPYSRVEGERSCLGRDNRVRDPLGWRLSLTPGARMTKHKIYAMSVASVYPAYVAKAERKGRSKAEVNEIIAWLTGHDPDALDQPMKASFEDFFAQAPAMNPARSLITGVVCGVRVENIEEPTMREIRYLDKLIDELAKGKAMAKILRA